MTGHLYFDLPRDKIFAVDEVELTLLEGRHPYERDNASLIEANWKAEKQANPALYNGEVVLLSELAYSQRRVKGVCRAVRYSTFLYWRRERPAPTAGHLFAHAMPVTADNALVAVKMGPYTASPGMVYFAGGALEPQDFRNGIADLDFNMVRELREETGLDPGSTSRDPILHAYSGSTGTAIVRRFYLQAEAEEVAERIRRFVASQAEPEIEGPVIIRSPHARPDGLASHMPPFIDWHFSGGH